MTKDRSFIKEFPSINHAKESLNFKSASSITNALNKKNKALYAGGFVWLYKEDYDNNNYKLPIIKSKSNKILCIDENGNKKIFDSCKEVEKELGIFYATVRQLCSNTYKYNTKIKYKFSYLNDKDIV